MNKIIFIVDDDPVFCFIVEKTMSKVNGSLNFVPCANGKEGLEKLKKHTVNDTDHVIILLDINMPILNGWEFLEEIQSQQLNNNNNNNNIDIFILSSSIDNNDIEKAKIIHQ